MENEYTTSLTPLRGILVAEAAESLKEQGCCYLVMHKVCTDVCLFHPSKWAGLFVLTGK